MPGGSSIRTASWIGANESENLVGLEIAVMLPSKLSSSEGEVELPTKRANVPSPAHHDLRVS